MLHPEDELDIESPTHELSAKSLGGPNFELLDTLKPVVACNDNIRDSFTRPPLYMPCHTGCMFIVKRFISSTGHGSLRQLWLVLQARFHASCGYDDWPPHAHDSPICNVYPSKGWPGVWKYQDMRWEPFDYEAQV